MGPKFTRRNLLGMGVAGIAALVGKPLFALDSNDAQLPPEGEPYPIPRVDLSRIPAKFRRKVVPYGGDEWPGTLIVDSHKRQLFLVLEGKQAMRFGVGVGREGYAFHGVAEVGRKEIWPRWLPPPEMVARDEYAAKFANGFPGGPDNPLGARALYLFQNGKDTLYRIHGTNQPHSIGKALSSGCIRMLNQDVVELYRRVPIGTRVVVMPPANAQVAQPIQGIQDLPRQ